VQTWNFRIFCIHIFQSRRNRLLKVFPNKNSCQPSVFKAIFLSKNQQNDNKNIDQVVKYKHLVLWLKSSKLLGHQSHFHEISMFNPEKDDDFTEIRSRDLWISSADVETTNHHYDNLHLLIYFSLWLTDD
jgi:hypothetical protein